MNGWRSPSSPICRTAERPARCARAGITSTCSRPTRSWRCRARRARRRRSGSRSATASRSWRTATIRASRRTASIARPPSRRCDGSFAPSLLRFSMGSSFDDHLEAAEDEPLAVEGHRIDVGLETRVGHDLLHPLVTRPAGWPQHPGEHDGLVLLALHGHGERGHLAVRDVVTPALHDAQRAVLFEYRSRLLRMDAILLTVGGGNGRHESLDVGHTAPLLFGWSGASRWLDRVSMVRRRPWRKIIGPRKRQGWRSKDGETGCGISRPVG